MCEPFPVDVRLTVGGGAPGRQLPQNESEGIHVDAKEGVSLEVDGALQDLGSHVAPCPHLLKVKGQTPIEVASPHIIQITE